MPDTLSLTEARRQLMHLPEKFAEHPDLGVIALTRHGRLVMALMPWDLYEAVLETLDIRGDPEQMALLRQGIEDVGAGRISPWKAAKVELGL